MDYSEYISGAAPSNYEIGKQLVEQALWKYTSVFLAQPFEVAKIVLQVQHATGNQRFSAHGRPAENMRRHPGISRDFNDLYDVNAVKQADY